MTVASANGKENNRLVSEAEAVISFYYRLQKCIRRVKLQKC